MQRKNTAKKTSATAKKKTAKQPAKQAAKRASSGTSSKPKKGRSVGSASAASILGAQTPRYKDYSQMEVRPEWVKYKERLLDLRNQLVNQMSGLTKQFNEEFTGHSMHIADSGTDNFDRDFALSLLSSDQDAIYEIDEALKRMEKSTYGTCELTGKPIPKARLDAIPWARYTVEAQGQLESEGVSRQRRLGALGSLEHSGGADLEGQEESESESSEGSSGSGGSVSADKQ